jgi:chromosome segregation ATPase
MSREELLERVRRMEVELSQEVSRREEVDLELTQERQTIESVLTQMEMLELEGRSREEEMAEEKETLEDENRRLQRCLDDERAVRLQHMYQVSRSQAEAEAAAKEKMKLEKAVAEMDADQLVLVREMDALRSSFETSQRLVAQQARDLSELTSQVSSHHHDAHVVRARLVEAEADASRWRLMFEEAADSMAKDCSAFNKMIVDQRRARKPAAPILGRAPPIGQAEQRPRLYQKGQGQSAEGAVSSARALRELPALLPPGNYY